MEAREEDLLRELGRGQMPSAGLGVELVASKRVARRFVGRWVRLHQGQVSAYAGRLEDLRELPASPGVEGFFDGEGLFWLA